MGLFIIGLTIGVGIYLLVRALTKQNREEEKKQLETYRDKVSKSRVLRSSGGGYSGRSSAISNDNASNNSNDVANTMLTYGVIDNMMNDDSGSSHHHSSHDHSSHDYGGGGSFDGGGSSDSWGSGSSYDSGSSSDSSSSSSND